MVLEINSEREMLRLGKKLGDRLQPGDLLFLSGDLGAGKTMLTKGIAKGLIISEEITSPTFQIRKSYQGRYVLNHLDLYRVKNQPELDIIEPDELTEDCITVVEWGDLLKSRLESDYLEIGIELTNELTKRRITFIPHGTRYINMIEELD